MIMFTPNQNLFNVVGSQTSITISVWIRST